MGYFKLEGLPQICTTVCEKSHVMVYPLMPRLSPGSVANVYIRSLQNKMATPSVQYVEHHSMYRIFAETMSVSRTLL